MPMSNAPMAVSANAARRRFVGRDASKRGVVSTARVSHRDRPRPSTWPRRIRCMATWRELLREHVAIFFTNWRNPDYTVAQKVGLTVKNRSLGLVRGGCWQPRPTGLLTDRRVVFLSMVPRSPR